ncbi:MAG: hypothetical protein VX278_18605 [Myxococcota bacterium]|nr:hypothetical protein [Myxococcota bacterium]
MRLAFLLEAPNVRGTTVATYDYAHYAEELLGHESIIICNRSKEAECHPLGVQRIQQRFPVLYIDDLSELNATLKREKIDFMYNIRTGHREDGVPDVCRSGIHVMFQHYEPHGTVYAYISEWLSQMAQQHLNVHVPYVPHMVHGPREPQEDLRRRLGIPQKAIVYGRYGGFTQFDIQLAHRAVRKVLRTSKSHYFLFMNTKRFITHPQVVYVDAETTLQKKCDFIHACDAMLHARRLGESFGMSIAEFLYQGKPVITWFTGNDLNHVHMLGAKGIYFRTQEDLTRILLRFTPERYSPQTFQDIVRPFSPEEVMRSFQNVFLKES